MRPVPKEWYYTRRFGHFELRRPVAPGVVYLVRCAITGEHKFGATANPARRLSTLRHQCGKLGREPVLIWAVATNSVGRAESALRSRWRGFRIDGRLEWVSLPEAEVAWFRSFGSVEYHDLPPLTVTHREFLRPAEEIREFLKHPPASSV
jgi:hypothetical protein